MLGVFAPRRASAYEFYKPSILSRVRSNTSFAGSAVSPASLIPESFPFSPVVKVASPAFSASSLKKSPQKKIQCSACKQSRVIGVMIKNTTTRIRGRCYKIQYWVFQTCSPGLDTLKCNWISPDSASCSLYHWGPPFYGSNNQKWTNYRTVIHVNLMLWTSLVISGSNLRELRLPSEVDKMRKSMLGQGLRKEWHSPPYP